MSGENQNKGNQSNVSGLNEGRTESNPPVPKNSNIKVPDTEYRATAGRIEPPAPVLQKPNNNPVPSPIAKDEKT